jgi:hypothetical protein
MIGRWRPSAGPRGASGSFPRRFARNWRIVRETGGSLRVVLPGVPDEMKGIYRDHLASELRARFGPCVLERGFLLIGGRWESEVDDAVAGPCEAAGVDRTILASAGMVELHLTGEAPAVRQAIEEIRLSLGDDVISTTGKTLPETVVEAARERQGRLSVAESCTGGRDLHQRLRGLQRRGENRTAGRRP